MQKRRNKPKKHIFQVSLALLCCFMVIILSGCISKEAHYSDQQKRMLRCDQYIGQSRDDCLNGMTVTIEDYKQDWREFERDEAKREAEEQKELKKSLKIDEVPKIIESTEKHSTEKHSTEKHSTEKHSSDKK